MITQIAGKPRRGKTAFMTAHAVPHLIGLERFQDVENCRQLVEPMNASGYRFTMPDHLVFSNYTIDCPFMNETSYSVDPFHMGLDREYYPTDLYPPYARFFLDEGQEPYNSREKLPAFVSRYFEKHGHPHFEIMIASQRFKLIDLNIRDIAERFVWIEGMNHEYSKYGLLKRTVWTYYEFDDFESAELFQTTGQLRGGSGRKARFAFDGNIFQFYDPEGCFPFFFKNARNRDFTLVKGKRTGITLDEIEDYNAQYNYGIPDDFYDKEYNAKLKEFNKHYGKGVKQSRAFY
jgi:hypothetical protein